MRKKSFKKQVKRISRVFDKWIQPLGLGLWGIKIHYRDRVQPSGEVDGADVAMSVVAQWQYLRADIEVFVPSVRTLGDKDLELYVVHELMHIFVNEMHELSDTANHEERVCESLAKAVLWAVKYIGDPNAEAKE